jgi:hypothetical protein
MTLPKLNKATFKKNMPLLGNHRGFHSWTGEILDDEGEYGYILKFHSSFDSYMETYMKLIIEPMCYDFVLMY